jgi:hypothetical protein
VIKEYLGNIPVLELEKCQEFVSRIDSLQGEWINLNDQSYSNDQVDYPPLWTLGAASYRDSKKSLKFYHRIKNRENSILINNFKDLYDILLDKVSNKIGDVELEYDLALPGFHIFGDSNPIENLVKINLADDFLNMIHKDGLNDLHYDFLSNKYSRVDKNKIISITLSLQLPTNGGGLCVWDEDLKQFSSSEGFAKDILESNLYDNFEYGMPYIIPYITGSAFCFSGMNLHQIAPIFTAHPGDRRITLQAHGMVCDGAWRLFF